MGCGYHTYEGFFRPDENITEEDLKLIQLELEELEELEENSDDTDDSDFSPTYLEYKNFKFIIVDEKQEFGNLKNGCLKLIDILETKLSRKYVLNGIIKCNSGDLGFPGILLLIKNNKLSTILINCTEDSCEEYDYYLDFSISEDSLLKTSLVPF